MQFIKVKIEEVKTTSFGEKKGIYTPIYDALREFTKQAYAEKSPIIALDDKGIVQWYKVIEVNTSITTALNPEDSIGANIRAYKKRTKWNPAIKFAVQFSKKVDGSEDKAKISIYARKLETVEDSEPVEANDTETHDEPIDETIV